MKIIISTESTCDLTKELIEENNISIIPYTVLLGEDIVTDDASVPAKIFEYVEKTKQLPKTSAINEQTYTEYFEMMLSFILHSLVVFLVRTTTHKKQRLN